MDAIFRFPAAVKRDPAIDEWFGDHAPELSDLARPWFEAMRACGQDVHELVHDRCPTACVGEGAFGYVSIFRAHANVGFFFGAELKDPARLLEGTGKRMRHVKLTPGHAPDSTALRTLIEAAYRDMKRRIAE